MACLCIHLEEVQLASDTHVPSWQWIVPAAFVIGTVLTATQQHGMQQKKDDNSVVKSETLQSATHACLCITLLTSAYDQSRNTQHSIFEAV